ncbi:NapC/NirT family cytochrome c [Roseicella aerolata]|uniref:Cytochrome c-type protein n=1 Tax=Roseicella aerolata TaxID=2883479 RepID=A0A9X1LAZ5_9PROT|nr:NapC/NirT family cytochrome c [Roseicella aerolata]MCB4822683.1 NapC/NirT family cytochrome c [Roseicella aerolata]
MSGTGESSPPAGGDGAGATPRKRGPVRRLWNWFRGLKLTRVALSPATGFSLAFLTLGGFVAGVMFWGGFNTALEYTNRTEFCVGCHEMRSNVYEELQGTIHFTNRSGVRAGCPDCHVPHEWTDKIARKMQASKEVWGHIFGSISTREKFLDLRRHMAEREWTRMAANDSLECRNCHSAVSMDLSRQNPRAALAHERFLFTGERTCIDCHKGIAHRLPDMTGVPGWQ